MTPLSRRRFLQASLAALAAAGFPPGGVGGEKNRPNILFIALDDLNDWVGCLGGYPGKIHTPNIDTLAASGTLFTNAHCAIPLCNASRTSTLTGLSPLKTKVFYNTTQWSELPQLQNAITLPQLFRNNGYRAIGAGKIFHFNDKKFWDDFWPDNIRGEPDELVQPSYEHPLKGVPQSYKMDTAFDWGAIDAPVEEMPDYQITDWIIKQIHTPQKQPLFLGYGIGKPHLPWYLPKKYFDLYPLETVQLPAVLQNDLDDIPPAGRELINEYLQKDMVRNGLWKNAVQAYLASITFADEQLGRVMQALKTSAIADNTIIVLWSDHGWHLGEKMQWRKLTLWQEATHIPLIFSGPGIKAGQRCNKPVSLLDIYPTLAALTDISTKSIQDGYSLLPLLKDQKTPWEHDAVTLWQMHSDQNHFAIVDERYRLIRYADGAEELYDHEQDPHEWHNIVGKDSYKEIRKNLSSKIDDYNKKLSPH